MKNEALELAQKLLDLLKGQDTGEVELSTLAPGEQFKNDLGTFIVLKHTEAGTLIIQKGFCEAGVEFDSDTCDYTKSALKKKFDTEILKTYEAVFGENTLVNHAVELKSVDMQEYGSFDCKVRPITFDEAREFNSLLVNKELPGWYWTCTPWSSKERGWQYTTAVVSPGGRVSLGNCINHRGVRPVCILKSNIFVSKED